MTTPTCTHDLVLFDSDDELIDTVAPFVSDGVAAGDRVLIHADPAEFAALHSAVAGPGVEFAGPATPPRSPPWPATRSCATPRPPPGVESARSRRSPPTTTRSSARSGCATRRSSPEPWALGPGPLPIRRTVPL